MDIERSDATWSFDIFPWNDNFNTGLEEIDRQHRKLVALLNRLANHVAFKADVPGLNEILDELTDYTVYHFEAEEAIWHQFIADDETENQHKDSHRSFIVTIQRLKEAMRSQQHDEVMEEALAFLTRWLVAHIIEIDRRMAFTVHGIRSGLTLDAAKRYALEEMSGSTRMLIDIILSVYATLSTNTLNLMRELSAHKHVESALEASETLYYQIFNTSQDAIDLSDAWDGRYLEINPGFTDITGYTREEVIGRTGLGLNLWVDPAERDQLLQLLRQEGKCSDREIRLRRNTGEEFWGLVSSNCLTLNGRPCYLSITRDITRRKLADRALRIAAIAFESQEGMIVMDAQKRILQVNQAFIDQTGYQADELVGQSASILKSGRHDPSFYTQMWQSVDTRGSWQGEIWNRRKDGSIHPDWLVITAVRDDGGPVTNYVGAYTDLTQRKETEGKIQRLAFYDALTGLPNRRLLYDRMEQARSNSQRSRQYAALIYLDLDRFKSVNDSLGHSIGDTLLVQVAIRLQECVRESDSVARLGGDEFVVMLEELSPSANKAARITEAVAENICEALNQPYLLAEIEHHCSPSIGITIFKGKKEDNDELLKRADLAMYQAKSAGRNTIRFFDPVMQEAVLVRMSLETELRLALKRDDFVLHYQPQCNAAGVIVSVEALVRWQHPVRGLVPPGQFIPVAEETGLIVTIGQHLMRQACAVLKDWSERPETEDITLAVNVSPRQFHDPMFAQKVLDTVQGTGANPNRLLLEITEGILMENIESNLDKMHALRKRGIRFSIDDFGTGYSSLAYLNRLPLDELKIDRTFVKDLGRDENATAICATFIDLAHLLGLRVVAEGVETDVQRRILTLTQNCDVLQGFLFSPPLALSDLENLLAGQTQY